ncbi:hypothetical protein [Flammeovirga kamogawensis]|uniref:Lipoprotein n=1 Tax=Flammeovirga kamogawensis TaxID=373891 RepID=A0ABX8GQN2_9BACT|nr:hypothetical protein [Flammeovirga kamogawensis]MBB6463477.1 hypothetical protein [Flammeovirga kamogawensis]QWG05597.1 hypothetical protein KM029_09395 [Flammeovirga kamogawensis]TRX67429.1 hypothetical protein EO216_04435 [Flammeovirga kamogawensis]
MKTSVKLIIVLVSSMVMFSCSTMPSSENVLPKKTVIQLAEEPTAGNFLTVYLQPIEKVCNEVIIVEVELNNSSGYKHIESIASVNGLVTFSHGVTHDYEFDGGGHSITFKNKSTGELLGSTSFYLTETDLEKDKYYVSVTYNNCY